MSSNDKSNVLVTCGGKWAGLVLQLKQAMRSDPVFRTAKIVVASSDELTPAGCFADEALQVPPIGHPDYVEALLEICDTHRIKLLVPIIDLDLQRLTSELQQFNAIGTSVVCPPPHLTELCLDKLSFARFAAARQLDHPLTKQFPDLDGLTFPVFYKRRWGFGSIGSGTCSSFEAAAALTSSDPTVLFQQLVRAPEITVDAYISRYGKCIICVPRVRDKVVAGEAYKSHTIRNAAVEDLAMRTIGALAREGLRGPLNVQLFDTSPPMLLEVNTRFGSASVLSNVATNGRLLGAMLSEAGGGTADGDPFDFVVNLHLSRFLGDVMHLDKQVIAISPT